MGARLIIAYNVQGETRHHLTVAADSLSVGRDAIWASGRERGVGVGVLFVPGGSYLGVPGSNVCLDLSWSPALPQRGSSFLGSKTELAMLAEHTTRLPKLLDHLRSPLGAISGTESPTGQKGSARKKQARMPSDSFHDTAQVPAPLWTSVSPTGVSKPCVGSETVGFRNGWFVQKHSPS